MTPEAHDRSAGRTRLWSVPELDGMELFGSSELDPAHPAHLHETFTIGVVDAGVVVNRSRGETSRLPRDCVFTFNPGEVHSGHATDGILISHRTFYPGEAALERIAADMGLSGRPWFRQTAFHAPASAARLRTLHRCLERSSERLARDTAALDVFGRILAEHTPARIGTRPRSREPDVVRRVREYLDAHCDRNVSLDELAALADLNRAYLIRTFRRTVGMPPHAYLVQRRIILARALIRAGQPLADVALAAGFSDQSHMNVHFKRATTLTAGQYARSHFPSRHR